MRGPTFYNYVERREIPDMPGWFARSDGVIVTPWNAEVRGYANSDGYMHLKASLGASTPSRFIYIHRLVALAWVYNPRPDIFIEVEHLNGIRSDNRPENLKWYNRQLNNLARRAKGFSFDKRRQQWRALCTVMGKRNDLGYYKTAAEARIAYITFKKAQIKKIYASHLNDNESILAC